MEVRKVTLTVILLTVLVLSGWQVYGLITGVNSHVLSATTSAQKTKTIEERLSLLETKVAFLERAVGLGSRSTVTKEYFKQIPGGTVNSSDWEKIEGTDFWFDQSFYTGVKGVTWQGWVANGGGVIRIYDVTNNRVVDNSEISVPNIEKTSFYSKAISIWRGQNQYYLQGKNIGGKVVVTEAKLKILAN